MPGGEPAPILFSRYDKCKRRMDPTPVPHLLLSIKYDETFIAKHKKDLINAGMKIEETSA